jgi:hypothetical protein
MKLRPLVGKSEWVHALHTRDRAEASVLAMESLAATDRIIAQLETQQRRASKRVLTPEEVGQLHAEKLIRDSAG